MIGTQESSNCSSAIYDGFVNPRSVVLDKVAVWARILGMADNYLNEPMIDHNGCEPVAGCRG